MISGITTFLCPLIDTFTTIAEYAIEANIAAIFL